MAQSVPFARSSVYQPSLTVADLLLRSGEQQADAERRRGEISAQMWGGIGNSIASIPAQIVAAKRAQTRDQLDQQELGARQGQIADATQLRSGQAAVDRLMAGDQLPAGDVGPRQDSYLDSKGLFDVPRLTEALGKMNYGHLAPELVKGAEAINDSILKHQTLEQQAAQQQALLYGDMAHGAITLHNTVGMPIADAMDFVVQPGIATKRIKPEEYAQIRSQIAALPPDQQEAALDTFRDQAARLDKGETLSKDAVRLGRYGRTLASNVAAPKKDENWLANDAATLGTPNETPTAKQSSIAVGILKPGPKRSIEEEWLARDRRLAVAKNDGQPLTDEQLKAVDTKSMQEFATSKADPEVRAAALAQKAIAASLANMQLGMMPTKEQAIDVAKDIVEHRIAPEQLASLFSTRGKEGLAFKLNVASEAKKLDPNFNWEQASSEYQLAKSTGFQNTVRYMDSAIESIPRLLQNSKNLGNGDWKSWNQLANATSSQFNSTDLKRFKTDALLVGDEIAKILSGGGTGSATSDAKLKQATDIIGTADSVPAIAAAMDEVQSLMGNRRRALTRGTYLEGLSGLPAKTGTVDGVSYKVRQ